MYGKMDSNKGLDIHGDHRSDGPCNGKQENGSEGDKSRRRLVEKCDKKESIYCICGCCERKTERCEASSCKIHMSSVSCEQKRKRRAKGPNGTDVISCT